MSTARVWLSAQSGAIQVSQAASYLSLGTYGFATTMQSFVSSTLAINASHIQITDLVVEPGTSISQSSATVKLRVDLTATPAASGSAPMVRGRQSVPQSCGIPSWCQAPDIVRPAQPTQLAFLQSSP